MKKIQVSTVRQTADVEVIFINANLISKVIKADIAIDNLILDATLYEHIKPELKEKTDENGNLAFEPVVDEKGNEKTIYSSHQISEDQLRAIAENVAPLLRELVEAFNA